MRSVASRARYRQRVLKYATQNIVTTYKLKLNHGDLKATQGDEDRKINAQKFDMAFYKGPDLRKVDVQESKAPTIDLQALVEQLQQSPELVSTLAALIAK